MAVVIYALRCPKSQEVRYVGKTQSTLEERLCAHISKARNFELNHHCSNWIRKLLAEGLKPTIELVFVVPVDEEWQFHEKRIIAEFIGKCCHLTNQTGGGGGFYKADPDIISRRNAKRLENWSTPEQKERLSRIQLEVSSRPEVREQRSKSVASAWQDPVKRQAFINGMNTPEAKAIRSLATKRRYEGKPRSEKSILRDQKKAQAAINRAEREAIKAKKLAEKLAQKALGRRRGTPGQLGCWTPERRLAQADALNARREKMVSSPEGRERQKAAMREYWANKKAAKALESTKQE
jgi:hypothetical protein